MGEKNSTIFVIAGAVRREKQMGKGAAETCCTGPGFATPLVFTRCCGRLWQLKAQVAAIAFSSGKALLCLTWGPVRWRCVQDAMHNGPREKLAYVTAIIPEGDRPDYLCTVDLDPDSSTYSKASSLFLLDMTL